MLYCLCAGLLVVSQYHDRMGNLLYCAGLLPVSQYQDSKGKPAGMYCACLLPVSQYQDSKGNLLYCTVPVCCLCPSTRKGRETCCIVLCLSVAFVLCTMRK
jgi:hypothetical protein